MRPEALKALAPEQLWTMLIASSVRNALEKYHVNGMLPQEIMPELNRKVRERILPTIYALQNPQLPGSGPYLTVVNFHVADYWEVPTLSESDRQFFQTGRPDVPDEEKAPKKRVRHTGESKMSDDLELNELALEAFLLGLRVAERAKGGSKTIDILRDVAEGRTSVLRSPEDVPADLRAAAERNRPENEANEKLLAKRVLSAWDSMMGDK